MPPIQIQTSKPITPSQKSPVSSQPQSQHSSRQPSPTPTTAAKPPQSPTTLAPPPTTSKTRSEYAPASPTTSAPNPHPAAQPGAYPSNPSGPTPTGSSVPPPPRSPTRTVPMSASRTGTTPPPPQPGAAPIPGTSTAQSLLSAQPGGNPEPPAPLPGLTPSLSHPPGYQQQSFGHPAAAANTSMGMGSLTPLSRSNTSSPLPSMASGHHKRNASGAGLPDPGSGGLLNGYLPEGTTESAGQAWSAVRGWVGSTASSVGKKVVEVENQVWKKVNGE